MTAQEKLTQTVERLIDKIENSGTKWLKPWKSNFPMNHISKKSYSGLNVLNLWIEAEYKNYSTNNWLTFKQVKALKGTVKEGQKSTSIFFFKPVKVWEKDEITRERKAKTIPLLKTYNVFNIDQTSLEIEKIDTKNIIEIDEFIANYDIEIKQSIDKAYYAPVSDYIGMPKKSDFINTELYYATLLHEIAHSTGHEERLDRNLISNDKKDYAKEELIAETTRAFLQVEFNLDSTDMEDQNAQYLKSWLGYLKEDPKMLWKIFSEAQKAYNFLVQYIQKEQEKAA